MTDISDENIIWTPGIYHGRQEEPWTSTIANLIFDRDKIIELVQQRANEDGEWCINNGRVGKDNVGEPRMRFMMDFVANTKHITQALEHILNRGEEEERTLDYLCRDLANASAWALRATTAKKARDNN